MTTKRRKFTNKFKAMVTDNVVVSFRNFFVSIMFSPPPMIPFSKKEKKIKSAIISLIWNGQNGENMRKKKTIMKI